MDQSSISIINKNNGTLTGERAEALPIKLISNARIRLIYFGIGAVAALLVFFLLISAAKRQVVVVDVTGKAAEYQEYQLN